MINNNYIASYDNKILTIENIYSLNQRSLNKVRIFLGSKKEYTFKFDNKELYIKFLLDDEIIIHQHILMIIEYVEKTLNINVLLPESIQRELKASIKSEENFKEALYKLTLLKKEDSLIDNEEFKEFSNFCDSTLSCKLRDYQYEASYYLTIGNGGFDFSVPGAGKTIISYAAFNYFKTNDIIDSILIIGPINAYNAWYEEYYTCFGKMPDFFSLADLNQKDARNYLLSSITNHKEITFINVDKAWRLTDEIIKFMRNKKILLIVDEAHKQKNPEAKITQSVLEITKYATSRIILTGTPLPNGYEDLYTITKIYSPYENLLPYNYGQLKRFTKNGVTELQEQRIIDSIKPVYSRVSKKYLYNTNQLLYPIINYVDCELSKEQQIIYDFLDEVAFHIIDDFESTLNLNLMKAILIRKMQISANPGLLTRSIINTIDEYKNEYITEFFDNDSKTTEFIDADNKLNQIITNSEISKIIFDYNNNKLHTPKNLKAAEIAISIVSKGEKVILWDTFVQNMETIKEIINAKSNYKVELVNGSVTGSDRQIALDNFRNGDSMILIANPSTLAESISLHKSCQNAIYVNRNYNAAQYMQSKDRIHRINMPKNKTATYYFLINKNTIDVEVDERLDLKELRMLKILDSDGIEIGGYDNEGSSFMSTEDILNSFRK